MDSDFLFADDETELRDAAAEAAGPWKILVVDDDQGVHAATRFAFSNVRHRGRDIAFQSAMSGAEAISAISAAADRLPDLVLIDVVMATPTDGIDTTHRIRAMLEQRNIPYVIVRTGQAGTLLDASALKFDPDIDDVVFKQELTSEKLKAVVFAGLDKVTQRCGPSTPLVR